MKVRITRYGGHMGKKFFTQINTTEILTIVIMYLVEDLI